MRTPTYRFVFRVFLCLVILAVSARSGRAYTPESPEVRGMITKGLNYLSKTEVKGEGAKLGGHCIIGLAALKANKIPNPGHPLVQKAIQTAKKAAAAKKFSTEHSENYSLGIAIIFLAEVDVEQYRQEIQVFLAEILRRQQAGGGWGYHGRQNADISQTQYGALGMWMCHRQGIDVPLENRERLCNFLIRTIGPEGMYGYQATDPGNYTRITQTDDTLSGGARPTMSCAGVGSLYIAAELLGLINIAAPQRGPQLPPAFKLVVPKRAPDAGGVDPVRLKKAMLDGDRFFGQIYKVDQGLHQAYYMYGLERYATFRELASLDGGKKRLQEEPAWYNAGVQFARKKQARDGSWNFSGEGYGPAIQTAFVMLFLSRSAKGAVERVVIEQGRLQGGKGLSDNLATARVNKKGQVVTATPEKATSELLKMLDDPKSPQAEYVSDIPEKIVLSRDPKKRRAEVARLRRLLINGSFQARLTAAKTLGTIRDLENGPYLIFALSDPDRRIVRSARESLRFMSRKPQGFNMDISGGKPTEPIDKPIVLKAQQDWTGWLLSVKPDAELLE